MARIEVAQNLRIHLQELADIFELAFATADPIYTTRRQIDMIYDGGSISVRGDFVFDDNGDLIGGKLSKIELSPNSGAYVILSELELTYEDVVGALFLDSISAPADANNLVNLIYDRGWIINGTDSQDNLLEGPLTFDGDDFARLGGNSDEFFAGGGNDTVLGQAGNDTLSGGDGDDLLNGGNDRDQLFGNNGDDMLIGGKSRDRLQGGTGDDTLDGGTSHDRLQGGNGKDVIIGGHGNDRLAGGGHEDEFVFNANDSDDDVDTITDFDLDDDTISILLKAGQDVDVTGDATETTLSYGGSVIILEGVDVDDFNAARDDVLFTISPIELF